MAAQFFTHMTWECVVLKNLSITLKNIFKFTPLFEGQLEVRGRYTDTAIAKDCFQSITLGCKEADIRI